MDPQTEKRGVVIVAAGTGSRMGGEIPKQFMNLAGKPVLAHTIQRFLTFDPDVYMVVVLAESHRDYWEALKKSIPLPGGITVVPGGETRFESVRNGLGPLKGMDLIAIHDAVRPLVSLQTLKKCFDSARQTGSAIPVTELEDTIRIIDQEGHSKHVDRTLLKRVQTPQVFRAKEIRKAYKQPFNPAFTDDASVYESCFGEVSLVPGNPENIKITTPTDLKLASLLVDPETCL